MDVVDFVAFWGGLTFGVILIVQGVIATTLLVLSLLNAAVTWVQRNG